jgi:hypothetical protein
MTGPAASARNPLVVPDLRGRETKYIARCVADNWVLSAGSDVATKRGYLALQEPRIRAFDSEVAGHHLLWSPDRQAVLKTRMAEAA